jgi:hypothetical protein
MSELQGICGVPTYFLSITVLFSGDASAAVCELVAGAAQRGARRRLYLRRLYACLQVAR